MITSRIGTPRQVGNDTLSITVIYRRLKRRRAERHEIGAFSDAMTSFQPF
jgi:hypothetical protein